MIPDISTLDGLACEHRHTLLCEAEQERKLAMAVAPKHASHALQRLAGTLGGYLIALGIRLKRFEQRGQAVESNAMSSP